MTNQYEAGYAQAIKDVRRLVFVSHHYGGEYYEERKLICPNDITKMLRARKAKKVKK
jgi:hypothetical protein